MNKKLLFLMATFLSLILCSLSAFANHLDGIAKKGAVYTMTNAEENNQVVVYKRNQMGLLTLVGMVSTQGRGSGGELDPLGSQGSLILTKDHRWLLAVNAGSNEISVFRVLADGLKLVEKVDSGGQFPVSLTVIDRQVYVLNAGESPNITGYYLSHCGRLRPIQGSTRPLGSGAFAQVGLHPAGGFLVVTNRGGDEILVFPMDEYDLPANQPVKTASSGKAPFGFVFGKDKELVVAEAGSGAVSLYQIRQDGTLKGINLSVENGQQATCWIVKNRKGYIYTANTVSDTISAYRLLKDSWWNQEYTERLVLLDPIAGQGSSPIDMDLAAKGQFLYVLNPAAQAIDAFEVQPDGGLRFLGAASGEFSIFAQGVAAY